MEIDLFTWKLNLYVDFLFVNTQSARAGTGFFNLKNGSLKTAPPILPRAVYECRCAIIGVISCFSFDVRGRLFNQAKLWSSPTVFGVRAFFRAITSPATLVIDNIQLTDEGVYRCRVDFNNSPTRNSKVNFTVIGKRATLNGTTLN